MVRDDQPDAREGQAGRLGVAERSVVPMKPGNSGGGKGPWFKTDARRRKGREIGQPINSKECSETTEGVTRESEGSAWLPFLCSVRQDLPGRHPGVKPEIFGPLTLLGFSVVDSNFLQSSTARIAPG